MLFFFLVFRFFITLQNYVNAKLDKTEMQITSNEFITECYQQNYNIIKKNVYFLKKSTKGISKYCHYFQR